LSILDGLAKNTPDNIKIVGETCLRSDAKDCSRELEGHAATKKGSAAETASNALAGYLTMVKRMTAAGQVR